MAAVTTTSASHLERIPFNDDSEVSHKKYMYEPDISSLPIDVQQQLQDVEEQLQEGEITEKGYRKKRSSILLPYLLPYAIPEETNSTATEAILLEPDLNQLPRHVLQQLDILKDELENDEITPKGFAKRRSKVLEPYMLKEPCMDSLPPHIQKSYKELETELLDEDITEKGFKKKKMKLIKPFLVAANPSSYDHAGKSSSGSKSGRSTKSIQTVLDDGQKVFKCKICGETFKQAQSFSGHCRLHRSDRKKQFKCAICNAFYTSKSHLKFHMYKHTGNFPYSCVFCGKGFAGRSQHKYHELRHTGGSPYTCELCGGRFWKRENYVVHQSKPCLSDSSCKEATNLIADNGDDSSSLPFTCTVAADCTETFASEEELGFHMSAHGIQAIAATTINLDNVSPTMTNSRNVVIINSSDVNTALKNELLKENTIVITDDILSNDKRNENV